MNFLSVGEILRDEVYPFIRVLFGGRWDNWWGGEFTALEMARLVDVAPIGQVSVFTHVWTSNVMPG